MQRTHKIRRYFQCSREKSRERRLRDTLNGGKKQKNDTLESADPQLLGVGDREGVGFN